MLKRKKLWMIPVIVGVVALAGVFVPGSMLGGAQSQIVLAAGAGQQSPQVHDYFYKMSKKQVELRNELLKQNPALSEGEILAQVAPQALRIFPEDFIEHLCQR
jgi:flagellar basal body-associated protein FliL